MKKRFIVFILILLISILILGCTNCTTKKAPVCGADGKTYVNACLANKVNAGIAYNGTCKVKKQTTNQTKSVVSCLDSDSGKEVFKKGIIKKGNIQKTDKCSNSTSILEYYCYKNNITTKTMSCPAGYLCSDGSCQMVKKQASVKCQDSDNGKDIQQYGVVVFNKKNNPDYCTGNGKVYEYYCEEDKVKFEIRACEENAMCVDGHCVEVATSCKDEDAKDEERSTTVRLWQNKVLAEEKEDFCADADNVIEFFCEGLRIGEELIYCGPGRTCHKGKCISSKCEDTDGGKDIFSDGLTSTNVESHKDHCEGNDVREFFCDGDSIKDELIGCPPGYNCNNDECVQIPLPPPPTPPPNPQTTCTDSDSGKDYSTKGDVIINTSGSSMMHTDYCSSSLTLEENYCDGNVRKVQSHTCVAGNYCDAGKCAAEPTCNDPDGLSLTTKTIVTKGSKTQEDYCQWDNPRQVNEAVCDSSNKVTTNLLSCPSGKWCASGICVTEPPCTETDSGKDYPTYGSTTKGTQSNSDYCMMGKDLKEFYCDATGLFKEEPYTCPNGCQGGRCNP